MMYRRACLGVDSQRELSIGDEDREVEGMQRGDCSC